MEIVGIVIWIFLMIGAIRTFVGNSKIIENDKEFAQKFREKNKKNNEKNINAIFAMILFFVLLFIMFFLEDEMRERNLEILVFGGVFASALNLINCCISLNKDSRRINDEIILEKLNAKKENGRIVIELDMNRKVRIEIERIKEYWDNKNQRFCKELPAFNPFSRYSVRRDTKRFAGMKATVPLNKSKEEMFEIIPLIKNRIREIEGMDFAEFEAMSCFDDATMLKKIRFEDNFLIIKIYKKRIMNYGYGFEEFYDLKVCECIKEVVKSIVELIEK